MNNLGNKDVLYDYLFTNSLRKLFICQKNNLSLFFIGLFFLISTTAFSQTKTRVSGAANWNTASTWIQLRTGTASFTNASATVTGTGTLFTTELQVGDVLMLDATPGTTRGTITSIQSNTSLTLTSNASATASGAYGRQTVPGSSTDVQIGNTALLAITLSLDVSATVNSLTFIADATANTLSNISTNSLTVNNNVTLNQPTASVVVAWNINAGSATVGGSVTFVGSATATGRIAKINQTSGSLNIAGDLVYNLFSGSSGVQGVVDLSGGAASLTIGGTILLQGAGTGLLTPGASSTVTYNGSGAQTIGGGSSIAYHNLTCAQSSGTITAGGALSISGTLTVNPAITLDMVTYALSGNLTISGLTTLKTQNTSSTPLTSGITWTGIVYYNSASAQTIVNGNYTNLDGSNGNRTLGSSIGIAGTFTTGSGAYTVSGSTVDFNGTSAQTIPAFTFNNITFSNGGTKTFSTGSISGVILTISSGATFQQTGGTINLTGVSAISGTFSQSAGTFLLNNTLNINGTFNQSGGIVHMASSLVSNPSNNININSGAVVNQSGGTIYFNDYLNSAGTVNQTGASAVFQIFHDWKPGAGNLFNSTAGTVRFSGSGGIVPDFSLGTIQFFDVLVDAGVDPKFANIANSNIYIRGSFTNNNTGLSNSTNATFIFNGTGTQNISSVSTVGAFGNITINKASGSVALLTNIGLSGSWNNITNSGLSGGSFTVKFNGTGTISGTTSFPSLNITSTATTYTLNNDNSCTNLTLEASSNSTSLTHNGSVNLNVTNDVAINQPTTNATIAWNINTGSATVGGLITFAGSNTTSNRIGKLVLTSGTLNANGGITFVASAAASKVIDMSGGASFLNLKGALTVPAASSTLTAGTTSFFNFADDTNAQTINFFSAGAYNNLRTNNTSVNGAILSAAITTSNVTNNFRVLSGICSNGGFAIALNTSKIFEVANGATFKMTGTSGMVTGTTITKTFGASSTCEYAGTTQTVSTETYGNLTLSGGAAKTMPGTVITVAGNFLITASGTTATAGAAINTTGSFTLGSGTTFSAASFTHAVGGNWSNSGTFTASSSTVNFNGSSLQTIGGSGSTTYNNISINNNAGATLSLAQSVNGVLTFTNGLITTTATNLFTMAAGSSVSGAGTGKFINGPLRKNGNTSFTFPLGKSGVYAPLSISAPASSSDAFTAEYLRSSPKVLSPTITASGVAQISNCEYWQLDRTAGSSNVNVTLSWSGASPCNAASYITDLATLTVVHFNGTSWNSHGNSGGTTGNASSGTVTWNNVSTFSPFTFGSTSETTNPLPVKFHNLRAAEINQAIQLDWRMLTETNIKQYEIERSLNGQIFTNAGQLLAKGNNGDKVDYTWLDLNPGNGIIYYRIKAVDLDGKLTYSTIIRIQINKASTGITLYPNPVIDNRVNFEAGNLLSGQYKLVVNDITGRTIYQMVFNHSGGAVSHSLQLPAGTNPGIYLLQVNGINFNDKKTFIIQ